VAPVLFGLGAVSAAKYPDGALAEQSRRLRRLVLHLTPALSSDLAVPGGLSLSTPDLERVDPAVRVTERVP